MATRLPYVHIAHLVSELRLTARETLDLTLSGDDAALLSGINAALMNDAADALEALAQERTANRPMADLRSRRDDRQQ